ncbi:tetraacyldisaccharide 4'-kinase [Helicobacter sp. 23-1046]
MRFVDSYFYRPNFFQKCLSIALLPVSVFYGVSATLRRVFGRVFGLRDFGVPIVSVGNLVVGGSGKTPFIIEVAREFDSVAVISRGYKRKSKGLLVVSHNGKITCKQVEAGDEAFLIAKSLPNATVIVCKNRTKAIEEAKNLGAKCIFLDDGFRFAFKKLNILLQPKLAPYFPFVLPSGIYREMPYLYKSADLLVLEGRDYDREVVVENQTQRMLLLTAIANPSRLEEYLPAVVGKIFLSDHSRFDEEFLRTQIDKHNATSLLVTSKDEVKLQDMGFELSVLRLKLRIDSQILRQIREYITSYTH